MNAALTIEDLPLKLLELLSGYPDIQTFIDKVTDILGNPVAMVDTRFRILYASEKLDLRNPLWNKTMAEHYVSDGIITSMEKNEIIEKIRGGSGAFILDLPDDFQGIRVPLFYRDECCGFIGVYNYLVPFGGDDARALEMIAQAVTVLYNADPNILGRIDDTRDDLFLELVKSGSQEMAGIIMRRNSSISFGAGKIVICLTRRINGMSAENVAFGRLKDSLSQRLFYHVSAIYNNRLLLMFSLEKVSHSTRESMLDSLNQCCEKYDLNAGVSFEFDDDTFVPLAYKQALKASFYGEPGISERARISYYEDYMLKDIMNASLRVHGAKFYQHPVITKLLQYDQEFGTRYIDTLRSYLENLCNMKTTALELNVHYNTIKYRISMIEEISGRDLKDDSALLMRLEYSLRIYDFAREYHKP